MLHTKNVFIYVLCITHVLVAQDKINFIQQFVAPDSLVFDVGAFIGSKTELYLVQKAKVICIEPQPYCCEILQKKFSDNPQVIIEQVGLAQAPGTLTFFISSNSPSVSTFSPEWREKSRHAKDGIRWDKAVTIKVDTLDHLIEKYGKPYFCKIDVENFEYEVLKGLSQPITYLSFEFHIETLHHAQRCLEYLETIGYQKFNFAAGEHPQFILGQWVDKKTLVQEITRYKVIYFQQQHDPLWGDIYAHY